MRLHALLVLFAAAAVLALGTAATDSGPIKIGVVDIDQAISSTDGGKAAREGAPGPPFASWLRAIGRLVEHVDVLPGAHVLEHLRPDRHADLTQVGLLEQEHVGPGLPDAAADRQRDLVIQDHLVVRL